MINLIAIFIGGGIGALLRLYLLGALNSAPAINVLIINAIGCCAMGALFAFFSNKGPLFSLFSIGVLGSFTTMSAFTNNSLEIYLSGKYLNAILYSLSMVIICIMANIIGYAAIKKILG
jgi:CrcB protein